MKNVSCILFFLLISGLNVSAQTEAQNLPSLDRIVASQFINVILEKGDQESIQLEYFGVEPDQVNVKVKRKKLHIYLDGARLVEKQKKYYEDGKKGAASRYGNASITAHVVYKELRGIEIRGEEELSCIGVINADKFKLKVYGQSRVVLNSLQSNKFKASIYGENVVTIASGATGHQVYRLFGENQIDTEFMESNTASSRIYGEGKLTVNTNDELKITAFGEPEIRMAGSGRINKNIILGRADIKVKR